jgi:[ribosomal protein S18]-alanine N-acetyltransferase
VRADNLAAIAFYRREGFAEIARRRSYYVDGTDAVVMQR